MKAIHHVCDIDVKPDAVWTALTTEKGLASWWSTKVSAPPATAGSIVHFTFRDDFNPDWADGTFEFRLELIGDNQTRLRFWQYYAVELADDYYGVYNFNWGYYLESLSEYCSTGKGKPFEA